MTTRVDIDDNDIECNLSNDLNSIYFNWHGKNTLDSAVDFVVNKEDGKFVFKTSNYNSHTGLTLREINSKNEEN